MASEFEWVEVSTDDEMEAFFLSKLPAIREAARSLGYAIGQHGSMRRDMDLIAAPWVERHATLDMLAEAIHRAACGLAQSSYRWEKKPCGRAATSMPICWPTQDGKYDRPSLGCIDLSVMPSVKEHGHE